MNYLIEFDGQNNQKKLNFDTFSTVLALLAALLDPLYSAKFSLFYFICLDYIIFLRFLT